MRYCSKCKEGYSGTLSDHFYKDNRKKDGLQSCCKTCYKQIAKENHAKNRESQNQWQRDYRKNYPKIAYKTHLKRYGLTFEEYAKIWDKQEHSCASCKRTDPGTKRNWHIDHEHDSGKVRGILCHYCNTGIGLLGDNIEGLKKALKYLEGQDD